jgi:hypothetical protein
VDFINFFFNNFLFELLVKENLNFSTVFLILFIRVDYFGIDGLCNTCGFAFLCDRVTRKKISCGVRNAAYIK